MTGHQQELEGEGILSCKISVLGKIGADGEVPKPQAPQPHGLTEL